MTPDQAIEFMKKHKILHLKCADLEISLHPLALEPQTEPDEQLQPEKDLDNTEKSPVSGLTRRAMFEHFGFVNELEFRKKA